MTICLRNGDLVITVDRGDEAPRNMQVHVNDQVNDRCVWDSRGLQDDADTDTSDGEFLDDMADAIATFTAAVGRDEEPEHARTLRLMAGRLYTRGRRWVE